MHANNKGAFLSASERTLSCSCVFIFLPFAFSMPSIELIPVVVLRLFYDGRVIIGSLKKLMRARTHLFYM
jgi:hypothetical protein